MSFFSNYPRYSCHVFFLVLDNHYLCHHHHLYFLNPMEGATSLKHRLQYMRLYLRIMPLMLPHFVHFLEPFPYFLFISLVLGIFPPQASVVPNFSCTYFIASSFFIVWFFPSFLNIFFLFTL